MKNEVAKLVEPVPRLAPFERLRFGVVSLCAAAVALLLVMHYTAALHQLGIHDALRRLFYLPVIVAAVAAGSRGGLTIAGFAVVGFLPHLRQLASAGDRVMDSVFELLLLLLIGERLRRIYDYYTPPWVRNTRSGHPSRYEPYGERTITIAEHRARFPKRDLRSLDPTIARSTRWLRLHLKYGSFEWVATWAFRPDSEVPR